MREVRARGLYRFVVLLRPACASAGEGRYEYLFSSTSDFFKLCVTKCVSTN